ncbi:unnamed protein product, partial [Strongylus vulgaris]
MKDSGVILCCENYLVYEDLGEEPIIRCPIPLRRNDIDDRDRSLMIICAATHKTKLIHLYQIANLGDDPEEPSSPQKCILMKARPSSMVGDLAREDAPQ